MFFKSLLLTLCILSTGCVERLVFENFQKSRGDVRDVRGELAESWRSENVKELSWKEALELLDSRNLELQRIRYDLKELRGERKYFVWRQLDPRLIAYVNFNSVLGELSSLSSDGFGASLLGSVNVPDPIGLYGRRYALELQYYQNLLRLEETKRNLRASLYDLFLIQKDLEDFDQEKGTDSADYKHIVRSVLSDLRREERKKQMQENLRVRINTFFDSPGGKWHLKSETLPNISYAKRMSRLDYSKGYGKLAVYQMAGQLEVANAQLWQVKYAQVPRLSSGVSLPQFYSNTGNQDFRFEDVGLFMSLNRSIEFTGRRKRNRERARRQVEYIRHTMKSRIEQEMVRFNQSKRLYKGLVKEGEMLERNLQFLKKNPPTSGVESMVKYLKELDSLKSRIKENERRQQRMDLRFWVWDDEYWGLPF